MRRSKAETARHYADLARQAESVKVILWKGVEKTDSTFGRFGFQNKLRGCTECWAMHNELHRPHCSVPEARGLHSEIHSKPGLGWVEHPWKKMTTE